MLLEGTNRQRKMEFVYIEDLVPEDHILRKIDKHIDFSFINDLCRPYYCENNGRPAIEPEIMFKMLFIGYLFGIRSETRLVEDVKVNIAYRWFIGSGIEECTRWTFREMYDERSTYNSTDFLKKLILNCPFPIREIQTDNGIEFTRALKSNDGKPSLFEKTLEVCNIKYHRIRVATPRHNGKVERQHRTDEKRFYKKMKMYNLMDGRKQLEKYNHKSNNIPKICLGFLTPNEMLSKYLGVM